MVPCDTITSSRSAGSVDGWQVIVTTPASLQPHQRTSKKAGGVWLPGAASLLSSKKEVSQNQKRTMSAPAHQSKQLLILGSCIGSEDASSQTASQLTSNTYRQQYVRAVEPWNTI
jgi:hypothetical protein